jgi:hypothetical protein
MARDHGYGRERSGELRREGAPGTAVAGVTRRDRRPPPLYDFAGEAHDRTRLGDTGLEAALLIPLTVRAPYRHRDEAQLVRFASLLLILIGLVTLANVASLVLLVRLVLSGGAVSGRQLVFSGIQIWLTLILVFALWFWEVDRGGPRIRGYADERDFLFPQMASHELGQTDWMPQVVDYLYLSFTNATAFSPTDTMPLTPRAKAMMAVQALASITTIVMVAGRAVNILK